MTDAAPPPPEPGPSSDPPPPGVGGPDAVRPILGLSQWFHYRDRATLHRVVGLLRELGCRHLRTGLSWADFVRPDGENWYREQAAALAEFEVLLCVNFTPPSISRGGSCNSPPRRLEDFRDFVRQAIELYGAHFTAVELWNEPNVPVYWDYKNWDGDFRSIAHMTRTAAEVCRRLNKTAVMGGISAVNHGYLGWLRGWGGLQPLDVLAVHQFPGMWWPGRAAWTLPREFAGGWPSTMRQLRRHADGRPCWVTETGFATWDFDANAPGLHDRQVGALRAAAACPAERVYWYSVLDLDPARAAVEGLHVEEPEYHLGLVTWDGVRKPSWDVMRELLAAAP